MHLEYVLNLKRKHNCLERCSSRSTFNREVEYKIILAEVSSGAGRPPSSSRPLSTCHSQWKGVSKQWFVNFIVCVYICTRVCGYIYIFQKKLFFFTLIPWKLYLQNYLLFDSLDLETLDFLRVLECLKCKNSSMNWNWIKRTNIRSYYNFWMNAMQSNR